MDEALKGQFRRPSWRAARFRLGLMIVVLCTCPIRRENFTNFELGRTIYRKDDRYVVILPPEETKGRRPYEAGLPPELNGVFDHYVNVLRPALLKGRASDRLWITWEGADMTEAGLYTELCKITRARLGISIPPHRFRDIVATSVAMDDPEHFGIVVAILQHRNQTTSLKYYVKAKQAAAVRKYQSAIKSHRNPSAVKI